MKVFIVAGGTGGHLYPGLALARALSGHEVHFVVRRGDLGRDILREEGFPIHEISGQGLPRTFSWRIMSFPFKFLGGWMEARSLLKQWRPDRVVGMGGYLSVPMILQARALGIRTLLHEQNVLPGLANRLLSRVADSVAISFPASEPHFPRGKTWVSGLPIRADVGTFDQGLSRKKLGLEPSLPTFFVFGGSLGARRLNSLVVDAWPLLLQRGLEFQVLHVTGANDFERVVPLYRSLPVKAKVLRYFHSMAEGYAASSAIVCRAGASTIAELLVVQRPALLVPYPHASNNHQFYNAQVIAESGLGKVLLEPTLTSLIIADFLAASIQGSPSEIQPRSTTITDAAQRLAQFITAP